MPTIKDLILEFYEKKGKQRTMFMFPELYRGIKELCKEKGIADYPKKDVQDLVNEMIIKEELEYWSSGSTTYIKLGKPIEELKQNLETKL